MWHNDTRLALKLLERSELAKRHITATGDEVRLKNPEAFQACVAAAKEKFYDKIKEQISSDYPDNNLKKINPKKTSITRAVTRLAKLWAPTDKRLILAAVQIGVNSSGEAAMARSPAHRMAALSSGWSPTFGDKEVNEKEARNFCEKWCAPAQWHLAHPATRRCFTSFLKSVRHASPGPDGVPYCAWEAAGNEVRMSVVE